MTQIYLIRHAEAEGNIYRRFHGWYNSLITPNGYRQIEALGRRFEGVRIDAVYSSDLFRTMTTAGAIYKSHGLTLHTDPALREIGGGVWEDKPWGLLRREDKAGLELFTAGDPRWQAEGGETYPQVRERMMDAIYRLAAAHEGQTIALFSHGTAIRTVLTTLYGLPLEESVKVPHGDNTCVTLLNVEDGKARVVFANDNSHLGELSTLAKQSWWKKGGMEDYEKMNLWFHPLDLETEGEIYREARREGWLASHGDMTGFDPQRFFEEARAQSAAHPDALWRAMQGDRLAGVLQIDPDREADQGAGRVSFLYMCPETREQGLGIQLLGQAVSVLRAHGRTKVRLRCAPENEPAVRFYRRNGFVKLGPAEDSPVPLDLLEKYIGYEG